MIMLEESHACRSHPINYTHASIPFTSTCIHICLCVPVGIESKLTLYTSVKNMKLTSPFCNLHCFELMHEHILTNRQWVCTSICPYPRSLITSVRLSVECLGRGGSTVSFPNAVIRIRWVNQVSSTFQFHHVHLDQGLCYNS